MGWMLQGDWYVLEQETRKPFELYLQFNERIGEVSERIRRRLRGVGLIS
jgi:hypothetical protein